jgi:hypothetical protein
MGTYDRFTHLHFRQSTRKHPHVFETFACTIFCMCTHCPCNVLW